MSIANKLYDGSFSCEKVINQVSKETFFFVPSFLYKSSSDNANSNKRKGKNTIKIRIVG